MPAVNQSGADLMAVISDLGSGGAQRVLCSLVEHWIATGRKVVVVTLSPPEHDFFKLPAEARRAWIGLDEESHSLFGALINNARRVFRLRGLLKHERPAVAVGFVGPTAALLVAAAAGTGVRIVAAERNDPARQSFGPVWDRLRALAYRFADRVTVNSLGALETLRPMVPDGRLVFTPNPLPAASAGSAALLKKPVVLAVGRLHPQKGLDILLRAFACIDRTEWRLCLVGEGRDRAKLEALAKTLGIADRVSFEGVTTDPAPYYRAADIYVMASRHEGTPNTLMEAMAFGLPAIASDAACGPSGLVQDGVTGLITPVEDVAALARALDRLMSDGELRARLGAAARAVMTEGHKNDDAFTLWDAAVGFAGLGVSR